MKRLSLLLIFIALTAFQVFAQKSITGTVTDENGESIPGATIRAKGISTAATITNLDGGYELSVPDEATHLIFSYMGKAEQEIAISGQSVINVALEPSSVEIEEVIVTAIGVKKSEKRIGYAATTIKADDLTKSKSSSALNSLQGKVAGANITSASGAPGASTKIILRGYSTITGNNQPLYVIDGVPVNNSRSGSTSLNGGTDFGNQSNDINPEDIETMTVLKGSSATAVYGSRAANGVIVITTKKGSNSKKTGLDIKISSTTSFSTPLRLPMLQNKFGQGIAGEWDLRENTSFGPKFDGEMRYWGYTVDGARLMKPYEGLADNVSDFFEVGKTFNNSISLGGGNEKATYYMSFANINADGIMPYDYDTYIRNNFALRGNVKLSNNITSSASVSYINKKGKFVPTGQDQSVWNDVLQQPRDMPISELANYKGVFYNTDNYYGNYTTNPYLVLNEHGNNLNHDRVYGSGSINYNPLEYLSFTFRVGADVSNEQQKEWRAIKINSEEGHNYQTDDEVGRVYETTRWRSQLNTDFIVSFNRKFGDFDIALLGSHNMNQADYKGEFMGIEDLAVPYFYDISNTTSQAEVDTYTSQKRLLGVLGTFDITYKGYLTLTLTGRNDWSSTLPMKNNSFFYPSANISFVFSDVFASIKKVVPFGKIRLGWAQTGAATDPYQTNSVFVAASHFDGFTSLNYPLPSSVMAYSQSSLIGNPELQNELTSEIEVGVDMRFFKNRIGLDFTYYDKTTTELIYTVPYAYSSGFGSQTMNIGEITNQGFEIMLNVDVIKKKNLTWNVSFTFSNNKNELVELTDGLEQVVLGGLVGLSYVGKPGLPLGLFEGPVAQRNDEGKIIVNSQGLPIPSTEPELWGNIQNDYLAGATTAISYKGLTLSAVLDFRKGGLIYSRTIGMAYFTGISPTTTFNDRQPFIIPNSVIQTGEDEDGNPIYDENSTPILAADVGGGANTYWDLGGTEVGRHQVIDKTFLKLRELSLYYSIPKQVLSKLPFGSAKIGVVGRNLMIWTPKENIYIDPEMTTFGNDLEGDYGEFGALPTVRTIGFNLQFSF